MRTRYRIVVEGELGPEWAEWLDAEVVQGDDGRTVIEVSVIDQAHLHGMLRRLNDLHLRLCSVRAVD